MPISCQPEQDGMAHRRDRNHNLRDSVLNSFFIRQHIAQGSRDERQAVDFNSLQGGIYGKTTPSRIPQSARICKQSDNRAWSQHRNLGDVSQIRIFLTPIAQKSFAFGVEISFSVLEIDALFVVITSGNQCQVLRRSLVAVLSGRHSLTKSAITRLA
jgi:hypothetical protein